MVRVPPPPPIETTAVQLSPTHAHLPRVSQVFSDCFILVAIHCHKPAIIGRLAGHEMASFMQISQAPNSSLETIAPCLEHRVQSVWLESSLKPTEDPPKSLKC